MPSRVPSPRRPRLRASALAVTSIGACLWVLHAQQAVDSRSLAEVLSQNSPLGVENKQALLPSFDAAGRQSSLMRADVVRRVDDERLYAEGFVFEQFGNDPKRDMRIALPTAFYNMKTSTLRSTQRGKVSLRDVQIEGDSLIFDTTTNCGLMEGNIRTVIFDTRGKSNESSSAQLPGKP